MAVSAVELDALTGPDRRARALALAGVAGVIVGVMVIVLGGSLVGLALAGEAIVGGGLVAVVAATMRRRRRCTDPCDLAPSGSYTGGREAVLTGSISTSPGAARSELAELTIEGRPRGRLFVRPAADLPNAPDRSPDEPEQADVLTAGLRVDDEVERLHLEHRATHTKGSTGTDHDRADPGGDRGPSRVELRLVDEHGTTHAEAYVQLVDGVARWSILAGHDRTLQLHTTAPTQPMHRRATRRSLDDGHQTFLIYTRSRPKAWVAVLPEDLPAAQTLLCLWLVHLIDVHALLGRPWAPAPPEWAPVPDDFPGNVGPGGFGNPNPMISGGGGGVGGGS